MNYHHASSSPLGTGQSLAGDIDVTDQIRRVREQRERAELAVAAVTQQQHLQNQHLQHQHHLHLQQYQQQHQQQQHQLQLQVVTGTNCVDHQGAYDYNALLSHCRAREEQLAIATRANDELRAQLSNEASVRHRDDEERSALITANMAKMEEESASQREAMAKMERGKQEAMERAEAAEGTSKKLREEVAILKGRERELEEEVAGYCRAKEREAQPLQDENQALKIRIASLETQLKETDHRLEQQLIEKDRAMESKDALLNMQRQQMEEQGNTIQVYEKRFLTKGTDLPQVLARADDGERLWSRIDEREKKYQQHAAAMSTLRQDHAKLQAEKTTLQNEVAELNKCFELYDLKLSGTGDKVHMPWLLAQLRDGVRLKDRVLELEEIVARSGWTVMAADAARDFRKKAAELGSETERLLEVLEVLRRANTADEHLAVPVLLGKLEEAVWMFGHNGHSSLLVDDPTEASSVVSINTNEDGGVDIDDMDDMDSLMIANESLLDDIDRYGCMSKRDFRDFCLAPLDRTVLADDLIDDEEDDDDGLNLVVEEDAPSMDGMATMTNPARGEQQQGEGLRGGNCCASGPVRDDLDDSWRNVRTSSDFRPVSSTVS